MKLAHQHKATASFRVTASHVKNMSALLKWARTEKLDIIAIAHDENDDISDYTVRVIQQNQVAIYLIDIFVKVTKLAILTLEKRLIEWEEK